MQTFVAVNDQHTNGVFLPHRHPASCRWAA